MRKVLCVIPYRKIKLKNCYGMRILHFVSVEFYVVILMCNLLYAHVYDSNLTFMAYVSMEKQ